MKHFKLLLIAAIAVLFVLPAFAEEHHGKTACPKGAEKMAADDCGCMAKLNLTDKQKDEMQSLKKAFMEQKANHHEAMMKFHQSIRELMNADKPDMAVVEKKLDEQSKLWIKGQKDMIEHMMKMKAILTPEQQKIWKDHMMNCKDKCKDMKMMKHEGCEKGDKAKGHDCKGEAACAKENK